MSNASEPTSAQLAAALQEQHAVTSALQQQLHQMQAQFQSLQQHNASASPSPGTFVESKQKEPAPVKPDTFDGHPKSNPDRWLKDMQRYLQVSGISGSLWVRHCAAYLRESASTWMDGVEALDEFRDMSWVAFCELFIARFRPLEASRTARVVLKTIKQRTSVDEYNNRFRDQIKYCSDMAMEDQLSLYSAGLKSEVEMELYRVDPSTLEEAMRVAVRMDLRMVARNRERNSNGRFNNNNNQHNRHQYQRPAGGHSTSTPMDLSAIAAQQKEQSQEGADDDNDTGEVNALPPGPGRFAKGPTPNLSSEEFQRCRQAGICFKCKKTGHIARSCPANPPKKY